MSLVGTQFDRVNTEHAFKVLRRVGRSRSVAVVRQNHEVESGARRGRGNRASTSPVPSERKLCT